MLLAVIIGASLIYSMLRPAELRERVATLLARSFPPERFAVELESARYTLSGGLLLRDIAVATTGSGGRELLRIDQVRIKPDTDALLRGSIEPRSVVASGMSVLVARGADGVWAHAALLESRQGDPAAAAPRSFPRIEIEDCAVSFIDELPSASQPVSFRFEDVSATVTSAPENGGAAGMLHFTVEGRGGVVQRYALSGTWDPTSGGVRVERIAARADVNDVAGDRLPAFLSEFLAGARIGGKLDVLGSLALTPGGALEKLDLIVTAAEGRGVLPTGFEVESVSGVVRCSTDSVVIEWIRGLSSAGSFSIDGRIGIRSATDGGPGVPAVTAVDLSARFPRAIIDDGLKSKLPAAVREELDRHALEGTAGLSVSVKTDTWPPALESVSAELLPIALRGAYEFFPYPIEAFGGALTLRDGEIRLDPPLRGRVGTGSLSAEGGLRLEVVEGGRGGAGESVSEDEDDSELGGRVRVRDGKIVIGIHDVTTTPVLAAAIPSQARPVYESLDPVGRSNAEVTITWIPSRRLPLTTIAVRPEGVKIRHDAFPVTFGRVRGELLIDIDGRTAVVDLTGRQHQCEVKATGTFRFDQDDNGFDLTVSAESVSLDAAILDAIPERVRAQLEENRVSGESSVEVKISRAHDAADVGVGIELGLRRLVVQPPQSPVPLTLVGGRVRIDGTNVDLDAVRGEGHIDFTVTGNVREVGEELRAHLEGHVEKVVSDNRLLGLFRADARPGVRAMNVRGVHDFRFLTDFVLRAPEGTPRTFTYQILDLRSENLGMDVGVRLSDVTLDGELRGGGVLGETHWVEGAAQIRTASFNRLRFSEARLHLLYGREHPAVTAGRSGARLAGSSFLVDEGFTSRLRSDVLPNTLQILVDPADLYGGSVVGFFFVNLAQPGEFRGQFTATDVDIQKASRGIHADESITTTGTGNGEVRFSGRTGDVRSIVGAGWIEVAGASFADLPVVSSAVEKLAPRARRDVGFRALRADFAIHDGYFHTDESLVLKGSILNLRGRGTMDFHGGLNLSFVPEVVDFAIPFVDEAKKQIAEVVVTGTLERPRAELQVLRVPLLLR